MTKIIVRNWFHPRNHSITNFNYRPRRDVIESFLSFFLLACAACRRELDVQGKIRTGSEIGQNAQNSPRGQSRNRQNNIRNRSALCRARAQQSPKVAGRRPAGDGEAGQEGRGFCFDTSAPDCHREARRATCKLRIWNPQSALDVRFGDRHRQAIVRRRYVPKHKQSDWREFYAFVGVAFFIQLFKCTKSHCVVTVRRYRYEVRQYMFPFW